MKKNRGFVFMETIVVVSVLSLTLLLLFSSYSYILRKARERNTFDTTETLYKTYYTKAIIDEIAATSSNSGIIEYIKKNKDNPNEVDGVCHQMEDKTKTEKFNSFVCFPERDDNLNQIVNAFEVEKFYLVNPSELFSDEHKDDWLFQFDATTIDYLKELGGARNANLLIVKYKKQYSDGEYEVIHSSLEVK